MKYKLKEVAQIQYGKDHKKLTDGNIPVFGTGGLMRHVDNYLFEGDSVLIPRKGSLNGLQFVTGKFWTVDTLFWTKIDVEKVIPKYLFYVLKQFDFAQMNVGSAVPSLTTALLNDLEIEIPNLGIQQSTLNKINPIESQINNLSMINDNLVA
ncbi:restriction endonuclease subunit S [Weissella cibaria]|uniref:restriction endonuclease subunit S n=1 Tax=Weissella cibaria TaxID=137591 RepID=UPI000EC3E594|nr:restriction endonuclease subunit S [Weissella cibaria]WCE24601.1 restriction endonuclease subunit S [Weissella cibaria]WCE26789.1 restriction endonuclease subunit S [Weissella cibaria]HCT89650.1 type I restriction endonuclease subunit S [Acinetobacter pittii]